jgi:hypothetical protein
VSNGMVVPRQVLMRVAPVRVQHARRDIRVTFKTMAMFRFSHAALLVSINKSRHHSTSFKQRS